MKMMMKSSSSSGETKHITYIGGGKEVDIYQSFI